MGHHSIQFPQIYVCRINMKPFPISNIYFGVWPFFLEFLKIPGCSAIFGEGTNKFYMFFLVLIHKFVPQIIPTKNRHEATNLISIYSSINSVSVEKVLDEFGGKNFSTFKSKLSESIVEKICPIGKEIKKLLKDESYLTGVLEKGTKRADLIAKTNLKEIYKIVGLTKFTWKDNFCIIWNSNHDS